MPSIVEHAPDIKTGPPTSPDEICHGVCACQIDSTPRLALCGYDCTADAEGDGILCVVCSDIVARREPCRICGGLD